uniref:Uncharacterized protein n=1 Tax=Xiphophorus couchianus TaxID=32473 RepID=A0A3B5MWD3_9TELE
MPRTRQRPLTGSVSDGTEDSDSSAEREQTNSSESDGNMPKRQRLTRASTRLSQSSQDHDESPPLTPTGNAPSSESELDISSPNASHDESQSKDQANRDSDKDLSHRPKRRRCHETYNFNMKCPTPGCNSLGMSSALMHIFLLRDLLQRSAVRQNLKITKSFLAVA